MRYFWIDYKDRQSQLERGISFSEIVDLIEAGEALDRIPHPNQERHPGQLVYIVWISGYAYVVPFFEHEGDEYLITAYPGRKTTRRYLDRRPTNGQDT